MKKQLLIINLGLALVTSSFASSSLSPKFFLDKLNQPKASVQKSMKSHDGYANFSGHWVGTCDADPDEKLTVIIEQSADSSSILMDNSRIAIDAISNYGITENFDTENNLIHYRWSEDGQQILGTFLQYSKTGNMSQGDLKIYLGKLSFSMVNEQLVTAYAVSIFKDGTLNGNVAYRCVYNKS